jgi:molecular chaperone GrpE
MDDNRITPEEEDEVTRSSDSVCDKEKPVEAGEIEDLETLRKALVDEGAKAEQYLSNWQRAQADFANYKRRTEQEKEVIIKLANAELILNLLSVVDDLERALDHVSGKLATSKWVDGIVLIYRKFVAILEANGVSEIKSLGEQFDPCMHEAAAHVDGEEGKVVVVIQKGYMLNDRVLRPAMVGVGNGCVSVSDDEDEAEG